MQGIFDLPVTVYMPNYEHQWLLANRKGDRIKCDQIPPPLPLWRRNHHNSSKKILHFTQKIRSDSEHRVPDQKNS